jgi:hypothetical protein
LNSRPPDYESGALPLSYCGKFFQRAIQTGVAELVPMPLNRLESRALATRAYHSPSYFASALERTRTAMPFGTTPSRWRVYQFHHQGKQQLRLRVGHVPEPLHNFTHKKTGPTGLEPATSRVTVECSNQTELRPQLLESGSETPSHRSPAPDRLSINPF